MKGDDFEGDRYLQNRQLILGVIQEPIKEWNSQVPSLSDLLEINLQNFVEVGEYTPLTLPPRPLVSPELRICSITNPPFPIPYYVAYKRSNGYHISLLRFCFFLSRFAFSFSLFAFLAAFALAFFDVPCGVELPEV